jgi:4-diphosphocytidyl-2-C-methyl-D-erythritol kinase
MTAGGELVGSPAPWPAPAKLNLCLHIVGRRADGYHLLQSAIQFVGLCDQLRFWRRPPGVIERLSGPTDVPPDTDLVIRAARLLATRAARSVGVAVELHKRIPMQAGLGGGSSDAATTLVALNRLWGLSLPTAELAELGLVLGADVPVFVQGQAAWVEGIGEQLTPWDYPETTYLVVKPQASVSTAEIFNASELTRHTPVTTIRAFSVQAGRNDCTATVRARYPEVAEALDWLQRLPGAEWVRLTGTGACVFAPLPAAQAQQALTQLPKQWCGFVVQGLNRSPLLDRVADEERES